MTIDNKIRVMAGSLVLISVILAALFSKWWLLVTGFVGVNLIQSAFTGWCLAEDIMKAMGKGCCCKEGDKIKIEKPESEGEGE